MIPLSQRALAATAAAATSVALLAATPALAAHNVTGAISVNPSGVPGNDQSVYTDMTPDGRYVAFVSIASDLVPGDTNNVGDVFVRDRRTGVTERVSVGAKGVQGNGDSNFLGIATNPSISDDGRYVAFKSEATNLVKGDRNGGTDIFVRDRVAGTTERVSVDNAGREIPGSGGDEPAISPDGRYVAFTTGGIDDDFASDVYLRDRTAGTTTRVSVTHDGGEAFGTSSSPAVANGAGGPIVAFSSTGGNLVPDDGDSSADVFVRDLSGATPVTERVTVTSDETPPEYSGGFGFGAQSPSISAGGRYVAFSSDAVNYTTPAQTEIFSDIFVRDRQDGTTTLASPDAGGGEADAQSQGPDISPDGRFISFTSYATDLVAGTPEDEGGVTFSDAFVRDRTGGSTELVSVASNHEQALNTPFPTHVGAGPVSGDGLVSVFTTNADNLAVGDANGVNDVFFNDRRGSADLSLSMSDSPDPVAPKGTLTYTLVVTNQSSAAATGAGVVDTLPAGVTFSSASPGCTHASGKVDCDLGTIAAGDSRTVTISVVTKSRGTLTNTASAGSALADPDPADNTATETTTVAR